MIRKLFLLTIVFAVMIISIAYPASAQQSNLIITPTPAPGDIFVKEPCIGNEPPENGTLDSPLCSLEKGIAQAQSKEYGASIFIVSQDGKSFRFYKFERGVNLGGPGTPFPAVARFITLAILAMVLIIVGWQLMRRSRQTQN